eukprot:TRINITY_DN37796_c0_g1_i1.p1 TRINITY_DN37796_c0_g1~~TRINITY_DN37796_c0_g1_i1.p1  ORF type:complete len:254 (+),score=27.82 TRINITY_DN37796_c0_g1_i1:70-762(+)
MVPFLAGVPMFPGLLCWFLVLLGANIVIKMLAAREGSCLGKMMHGAFSMPVGSYVVSSFGQTVLLPLCLIGALERRKSAWVDWWFGSTPDTELTGIFLYLSAYFLADILANWRYNSKLLSLHHVAGALACFAAENSACWRGLNIALAFSFEVGSFSAGAVDLGWVSSQIGLLVMIWSTLLPLACYLHALIVAPPQDAWCWYMVLGASIGGYLRIVVTKSKLSENASSKAA